MATFISLCYKSCHFVDKGILKVIVLKFLVTRYVSCYRPNLCIRKIIGKVSFTDEQLIENFNTLQDVLAKAKPSSAKGTYFKSVAVTTTMGPGVKII